MRVIKELLLASVLLVCVVLIAALLIAGIFEPLFRAAAYIKWLFT